MQTRNHATTYHLPHLAENLGFEYLKALNVGRNAKYTSRRILVRLSIAWWKKSCRVLKQVAFIGESTDDVGILKQLMADVCAVKTRFLRIVDLADGKAWTIVHSITKLQLTRCHWK